MFTTTPENTSRAILIPLQMVTNTGRTGYIDYSIADYTHASADCKIVRRTHAILYTWYQVQYQQTSIDYSLM